MELRKIIPINKKGDFQSIIYVIAFLFGAAIILLLFNHLFSNIYSEIDTQFSANPDLNNTEAHQAIQEIQRTENSLWDYAMLGIAISYVIALGFTAFTTRLHPMFFWIYVIISIIGIFLAVMLSNTWQAIADSPALADTITRFPITNLLLGSFYPTFILAVITITMILMFGKFPGDAGQ